MPRLPRAIEPDTIVHVIDRGVERREIFSNDGDFQIFLAYLKESFRTFGIRLYSYCLMVNHFHLLAAPGKVPLGVGMHHLLTRYAHHYNGRTGRVGHLFQDRFKAIPCFDPDYFTALVAYIHNNPVRAGMVDRPGKWRWSSHSELVEGTSSMLELDGMQELVGIDAAEMRTAYLARLLNPSHRGASLEELIAEAAALVGLDVDDFRDGGRGESYSIGRKLVVGWGSEAGYTLAALARALNCSPQALCQLRRPRP